MGVVGKFVIAAKTNQTESLKLQLTIYYYHDVIRSFASFLKFFSYVIEIFNRCHAVFTFIYAWIKFTLKATAILHSPKLQGTC